MYSFKKSYIIEDRANSFYVNPPSLEFCVTQRKIKMFQVYQEIQTNPQSVKQHEQMAEVEERPYAEKH